MGLTQKLGTIPLAIFTDASNNIGIGGSPSGSYKFEVTGTGRFWDGTQGLFVRAYTGGSGFGAIYSTGVTAGAGNFALAASATQTILSGVDNVSMAINSAIKLYINNAGNVGIGTGSPVSLGASYTTLEIKGQSGLYGGAIQLTSADGTNKGRIYTANDTFWVGTSNSLPLGFITNDTERMRITSGGAICVNTTAPISAGRFNIVDDCNSTTPIEIKDTAASNSGAYMIRFVNNSNVVCGSIAHQSSTTTQYNTSSDYRLKTDLKDYNGLDLVSKVKTYDFEWIEDNSRMYGVLAHELYDVIPYAVNGEKDGEQMQGVDYSKLVPVLVKAIQELSAKVSALENKS
jgi:hypothetical protein